MRASVRVAGACVTLTALAQDVRTGRQLALPLTITFLVFVRRRVTVVAPSAWP